MKKGPPQDEPPHGEPPLWEPPLREPPVREPMFNAPLMVLLIPLVLIAIYALQASADPYVQEQLIESFALTPVLLRHGQVDLLLTHIFLHGSWLHVLANAAFCLAFSAPVIRACGRGFGGALSFIAFFLLCGILAGLGDAMLNYTSAVPILGASGAISGLIGAAIRIRILPGLPGAIEPLRHPRVIGMTVFWCGINSVAAFVPMVMGVEAGQGIAWQAHIIGYLFGLLAIGPWLRLFGRRFFTTS
ncbi:rhomboid family intramembrane serine protease [Asticcacaulis sp. EMRT-3]|uniref:rhomboid family intramembrane serine protease n=1 Tax=Asticcacaulis sp. EMRT-3 TaxID=3040349 RepID=UPI0024AF1670|nr:rhomboid family intramembrane serine protease [Asticcacaulis sp. EMRT-3]MDI7774156.1 rhomboid family intramembrane serine protease [Asticcacaulis sp. EMRT-3]